MTVTAVVKRTMQRVGVDVRRHRPADRRRQALIEEIGVATVLDVGANAGQYGQELRTAGYRGELVSFEPLDEAFAELTASCAADPRWTCVQAALSDTTGQSSINVAANSASSSLLPMARAHEEASPTSTIVGTQAVVLRRLDEVEEVSARPGPLMLKLDVQGHERSVLSGAEGLLPRVDLVEVELSVRELYLGAPTLPQMLTVLAGLGFDLVALEPGFHDPRDGWILQYDGLFRRTTSR